MSENARVARNTTVYTIALAVQKALAFLFFWYLSIQLGPTSLGYYVFALSFTTLFAVFLDIGIVPVITREMSRDQKIAQDLVSVSLGLKMILGIVVTSVMLVVAWMSHQELIVKQLITIAGLLMLSDSFQSILSSFFRAQQKLQYESIGVILFQVVEIAGGVIVLKLTGDVRWVMATVAGASISVLILYISIALTRYKLKYIASLPRKMVMFLLSKIPPFGFANIIIRVYNTADTLIMGYVIGTVAVGIYSIPAKVITALQNLFANAFMAAIYPAMSRSYEQDKTRLSKQLLVSFTYMLLISLPMAVGLFVISKSVIAIVWPQYGGAVVPMMIMALSLPAIFLAFPSGSFLNATNRQNITTKNRAIVTIASIVCNILFIPRYKIIGAASVYFGTNALLVVLDYWSLRSEVMQEWRLFASKTIRILLASCVMGVFVALLTRYISVWGATISGVFAYGVTVILCGGVTRDEIRFFISALRKKQDQ